MSVPSCGSVFSGAGLLDIGLHLAGFEHAWLCEFDVFRRDLLRKRFPGAVVYDDIRTLRGPFAADASGERRQQDARGTSADEGADGRARRNRSQPLADHEPRGVGTRPVPAAEHVTLVVGGFPCKGGSTAGKREGFEHAETVLWFEMRRVIREVRPPYVLIENVANLLGMAASPGEPDGSLWGTVLGDLAALGFGDIRWDCLPAAAVGAPHLRDRVFAIASHADAAHDQGHWGPQRVRAQVAGDHSNGHRSSADASGASGQGARPGWQALGRAAPGRGVAVDWGDYQPAIARWEAIHGTAPEPLVRRLDDGDAKLQRVRSRVDRSRLSACGDGVHVYVGWLVGEHIMSLERARADRLAA